MENQLKSEKGHIELDYILLWSDFKTKTVIIARISNNVRN